MKVMVTGAAGFLGTNLTRELLIQGHDVVGVDNLSTGKMCNVLRNRDGALAGRFEFFEFDINDTNKLEHLLSGIDVIMHCAALARVSFSIDYSLDANHANIDGTLSVLEAARKCNVKRIVFSSSSSVYGGVAEFPTPETAVLSPKSPYALHKATCEQYMKLYSELHGLDTVNLRYFNLCGLHQYTGGAYSTVIPAWMEKAVGGGTCLVNGDGEVSRDFCPVENVVSANILAAQHPTPLNGEVFNIACGQTTTINQVYDRICELAGFKVPKIHGPARKGDPKKSLADISKARTVLGYLPDKTFDECLAETYAWWRGGCKCQ